jgi:hypothetical protein
MIEDKALMEAFVLLSDFAMRNPVKWTFFTMRTIKSTRRIYWSASGIPVLTWNRNAVLTRNQYAAVTMIFTTQVKIIAGALLECQKLHAWKASLYKLESKVREGNR